MTPVLLFLSIGQPAASSTAKVISARPAGEVLMPEVGTPYL